MKPIAVTGGIATGKSTVVSALSELGIRVASADEEARRAFDQEAVQQALSEILSKRGPVSRDDLRSAIAESPTIRRKVNRVFHKEVWRLLEQSGARVLEVPLVLEASLWDKFSSVWTTFCSEDLQIARLEHRLGSRELAVKLIAAQASPMARIAICDQIIRTDGSIENVRAHAARLASCYAL